MVDVTAAVPRSVIVVSADHSALDMAMMLLDGQAIADGARLLLPTTLRDANPEVFPGNVGRYAGLREILDLVEVHDPQVVFLLSGYGLLHDNTVSAESLADLVTALRDRGCRVVTSDPLLGWARTARVSQMDTRMLFPRHSRVSRWLLGSTLRLRRRNTTILRVRPLETVPHLYTTSMVDAEIRQDATPALSFFNSSAHDTSTETTVAKSNTWVFVLTEDDVSVQRIRLGHARFVRMVIRLLQSALAARARPSLIAPRSINDVVARALPDDIDIVRTDSLVDCAPRIAMAEYAFFWNAVSLPLQRRIANEKPVFVFDRGYLSHVIKPFYHDAIARMFGGWSPPLVDQRRQLDPNALAALAQSQSTPMQVMRERWASLPRPDELVANLLR